MRIIVVLEISFMETSGYGAYEDFSIDKMGL